VVELTDSPHGLSTSVLSQSNYYYEAHVSSMCPSLLNRSCYPNNNVRI
jgi:hypothetical protein